MQTQYAQSSHRTCLPHVPRYSSWVQAVVDLRVVFGDGIHFTPHPFKLILEAHCFARLCTRLSQLHEASWLLQAQFACFLIGIESDVECWFHLESCFCWGTLLDAWSYTFHGLDSTALNRPVVAGFLSPWLRGWGCYPYSKICDSWCTKVGNELVSAMYF